MKAQGIRTFEMLALVPLDTPPWESQHVQIGASLCLPDDDVRHVVWLGYI